MRTRRATLHDERPPLAYCAECRGRGRTTVWECGALIEQCPVCCSRQVAARIA